MSKVYDLVIFDWDGTIVDSQMQIIQCMQQAFRQVGLIQPLTSDIRHIIGLSLEQAACRLAPDVDHETISALVNAYRQHAFANKADHSTQLFAGVRDMLDYLKAQNIYLAVATGKGRQGLDHALIYSGLTDFFVISRCADETASKPNPLMLEEILTDLNIAVDKAVMVGDTSYDLQMAQNIGMDTVAVTYGMHDEELLKACRPTHMIDTISKLKNIIGNNLNG